MSFFGQKDSHWEWAWLDKWAWLDYRPACEEQTISELVSYNAKLSELQIVSEHFPRPIHNKQHIALVRNGSLLLVVHEQTAPAVEIVHV